MSKYKPATFDPETKARIHEKYKDVKPAEPTTRPADCTCQWHSPEAGVEVRIGTSGSCPIHAPPQQ